MVPIGRNDESCVVSRAVFRAQPRGTIVFSAMGQSRSIKSIYGSGRCRAERNVETQQLFGSRIGQPEAGEFTFFAKPAGVTKVGYHHVPESRKHSRIKGFGLCVIMRTDGNMVKHRKA